MAAAVYTLCALTALACAVLILRSYLRHRHRLLLWSGLCFCGMFLNNALLILDRLALPDRDLTVLRLVVALAALLPILYGLIWERE